MTATLTGITAIETATLTGITAVGGPQTAMLTGITQLPSTVDQVELHRKGESNPVKLYRKGVGPILLRRKSSRLAPAGVVGDWDLIFQDEFNAPFSQTQPLNPAIWNTLRGNTNGSYANPYSATLDDSAFHRDQVSIENGCLKIEWEPTPITVSGTTFPYRTGVAQSGPGFSFTYGYIEARIWVPNIDGLWPAFWMLSTPIDQNWPPEIDIVEWIWNSTYNAVEAKFNVHWKSGTSNLQKGWEPYGSAPAGGAFHTYGFLWQEGFAQVFFDGIAGPVFSSANVPSTPHYIIFSGGVKKGFTPPPGNMLVDYVRVWQRSTGNNVAFSSAFNSAAFA